MAAGKQGSAGVQTEEAMQHACPLKTATPRMNVLVEDAHSAAILQKSA